MQLLDKHTGLDFLNADDAEHLVKPSEHINLRDFRVGSADGLQSRLGFWESIGGTILLANPGLPVTGSNIELGHAEDTAGRRILYFVINALAGDGIYMLDEVTNIIYTVLLSSQVTGGFNFDRFHPIHSAWVVNDCLYWTDNYNEPRRIDITAGLKLNNPSWPSLKLPYTAPLSQSVIKWIRREPGQPPAAVKNTDPTYVTTFIETLASQYAYRYQYRNQELSKLSGWSNTVGYNLTTDTFNQIAIALPTSEIIDQDVIQIDLVMLNEDTTAAFIIKSWTSTADAAAIAAHNAGTAPLSFLFYNDFLGTALDSLYVATPYDSVPLKAEGTEVAKNRGFLANYLIGYNSPTQTSLSYSLVKGSTTADSLSGRYHKIVFNAFIPEREPWIIFVIVLDSPPPGIKKYYVYDTDTLFPPTVGYPTVQPGYNSYYSLMAGVRPGADSYELVSDTDMNTVVNLTGSPVTSLAGTRALKSGSSYNLAVTFYDFEGRKAGVIVLPTKVTTPDRFYGDLNSYLSITWLLDNTNALLEIPDWAYYYSVDITLCLRTRYFQQFRSESMTYATKDADGKYVYTTSAYAPSNAAIAIDISAMNSYAQGYVYTEGDLLKLYHGTDVFNLSVIGQDGTYILCQNHDVGTLNVATKPSGYLYELYTPYKPSVSEPFYEQGTINKIIAPTTALRQYQVTSGSIRGDIYLLQRQDSGLEFYYTESMSPNDKRYKNWHTDAGRVNFTDTIGQARKKTSIAFSNTFIEGSKVNGLSTFDALNTKDISSDYGAIMKIVLTNKIELTGSIMLAICSGSETAALYLGENIIQATTGQGTVTQTNDIIGYVNNLRGSYGTIDPTSVIDYRGNVYWFDALNGKYIQYSDSGLFAISSYKMTRFWKLFADQYTSMTKLEIEALGSRPYVYSTVDPHNGELLVTIPKVLATPPNPAFDDYTPAIPYPFDIYDGQAKTLVYKITAQPNKWVGSYSFAPEGLAYLNDNVYSFYQGNLYQHNNPSNQCEYYGVQYKPALMVLCNAAPNQTKEYTAVSSESNVVPSQVIMRNFTPNEQGSDLLSTDFIKLEGKFFRSIFRDRLTPKFLPDYYEGLFKGDAMLSPAMYAMFEYDATGGIVQVKNVNFNYELSIGSQHT